MNALMFDAMSAHCLPLSLPSPFDLVGSREGSKAANAFVLR